MLPQKQFGCELSWALVRLPVGTPGALGLVPLFSCCARSRSARGSSFGHSVRMVVLFLLLPIFVIHVCTMLVLS